MNNFGKSKFSWSDEKVAKLRPYKLIKKKIGLEKYLELNERKYRKALSAFRTSAHRLNTEHGRYMRLMRKVHNYSVTMDSY